MEMGFHCGELKAQKRAGVRLPDDFANKMYKNFVPKTALGFLQQQPIVFLASIDSSGRVWASIIHGEPGFVDLEDERKLVIAGYTPPEDPLLKNVYDNGHIGALFMDFSNRRRLRVNGKATFDHDKLVICSEQVYGNCPKYITTRTFQSNMNNEKPVVTTFLTNQLNVDQMQWIETSDAFFIASTNNKKEMDASHRGGNPGFVKVLNENSLLFPDYFGNNMFNTLGNIEVNAHVGLIFIDFKTRKTMQMTGRAKVLWEEGASIDFPGAERMVFLEIDNVIESNNVLSYTAELLELSPFNPK